MFNMRVSIRLFSVCLGLVLSASMAWGEPNGGNGPGRPKSDASGSRDQAGKKEEGKHPAGTIPDAEHRPIRTKHTVIIAGQRVSYVAEAGMLPLLNSDGMSRASVFFVAYIKQDEKSTERRPVTFCFNGGPGSSSIWLHLARWDRGECN